MLTKLKSIYGSLIIENVESFDNEHYYFYTPVKHTIFGITKNITEKEYELLKLQYVEKLIYALDKTKQNIYNYLLENKAYPFKTNKSKFIIIKAVPSDYSLIETILAPMFSNFCSVNIFDYMIAFYDDSLNIKVEEISNTLIDDLGYKLTIHEGINIHSNMEGKFIYEYFLAFKSSTLDLNYSDSADLILNISFEKENTLFQFLKQNIYISYFTKAPYKDIYEVMIKNDLNVSLSAKLLYMNRNSLINKLDILYKETSFNIQKFKHACAIYLLSRLK